MKWYLQNRLKITVIYDVVKAFIRGRLFEKSTNIVSICKRSDGVDKTLEFFADTMKLIGNSDLDQQVYKSKHTLMQ